MGNRRSVGRRCSRTPGGPEEQRRGSRSRTEARGAPPGGGGWGAARCRASPGVRPGILRRAVRRGVRRAAAAVAGVGGGVVSPSGHKGQTGSRPPRHRAQGVCGATRGRCRGVSRVRTRALPSGGGGRTGHNEAQCRLGPSGFDCRTETRKPWAKPAACGASARARPQSHAIPRNAHLRGGRVLWGGPVG